MKVSEVMVKDVITVEENENISKVLIKMGDDHTHVLPITQKNKLKGIIVLKDLLSEDYDPPKTTVKKFKVSVPTLKPDDTIEDAAKKIIGSGYCTLPVTKNDSLVGVLSLTDLIRHVKYPADISAENFENKVITISDDENLGRALCLMDENYISRLPVINYEDKVIGCFDALSMIKFLKAPHEFVRLSKFHESMRLSKLAETEKNSFKEFKIKDYMRPTKTIKISDFSLKEIINYLQSYEEVILTNKGIPVGIVVPKDLIELSIVEEKLPIYISHYREIDPMMYGKFESLMHNFVKKFSKMFDIQKFFIYVETYYVGGKKKYSLRARMITAHKFFHVRSYAWDIMEAGHLLLDRLEKELEKYRELRRPRVSERNLHIDTEKCFGCTVCASLYPDLFEIGDDGHARIREDVKMDKEKMKEVIRSCPVQAIRFLDKKND